MSLDLTKYRALLNAERNERIKDASLRAAWKTEFDVLHAQFVQQVAQFGRAVACTLPARKRMNMLKALGRYSRKPIADAAKLRRAEQVRIVDEVVAEGGPGSPAQREQRRSDALESLEQSLREGLPTLDKEAHKRKPKKDPD